MRMTEVFIEVEDKILEHLPYCECMDELMDRLMASSVAKYGEENLFFYVSTRQGHQVRASRSVRTNKQASNTITNSFYSK